MLKLDRDGRRGAHVDLSSSKALSLSLYVDAYSRAASSASKEILRGRVPWSLFKFSAFQWAKVQKFSGKAWKVQHQAKFRYRDSDFRKLHPQLCVEAAIQR